MRVALSESAASTIKVSSAIKRAFVNVQVPNPERVKRRPTVYQGCSAKVYQGDDMAPGTTNGAARVEGSGVSFLMNGSIPIYIYRWRRADGYAKLTEPAERIGQRWRAT